MWVPFEETTYLDILDQTEPHDIIFNNGTGDLRLDRRMTKICVGFMRSKSKKKFWTLLMQTDWDSRKT